MSSNKIKKIFLGNKLKKEYIISIINIFKKKKKLLKAISILKHGLW